MNNILRFLIATMTVLALTACGGSSSNPQTPTYTISFTAGINGTLTGATSQVITQASNATTVTAVPATGYHFVSWTDSSTIVSTISALTITNITGNRSFTANFAKTNTTAILKINLLGALPSNTSIAGADITLTLPTNVTPLLSNGLVATGVVSPSGTFAGGTLTDPIYTAASGSVPGTLKMVLASSVPAGVTQVGEVATITLQLSNNATPTIANFGLSAVSIIDATLYDTIIGMSASVATVTLQ